MNQWTQLVDPVSGRVYYANCSTGETSWTPPVLPHQPPPPPPPPQINQHHAIGQVSRNIMPPAAQSQPHQCTQPLTFQQNSSSVLISSNSLTPQLDSSTAATPGLLVPTIRALIEKEQSQTLIRKIELEGVTAGSVADLCNISREWRSRNDHIDGGDFATPTDGLNESQNASANDCYYKPLQPFSLPLQSRPPHVEPGRVNIRMDALYSKLRSLSE